MSVPKRRPPRPHSCNMSRSPLRHRAAANPNQVMKPKTTTKMISAVQLTACMADRLRCGAVIHSLSSVGSAASAASIVPDGQVDDGRDDGADDNPEHLVPIEIRHAQIVRLDLVVERRP